MNKGFGVTKTPAKKKKKHAKEAKPSKEGGAVRKSGRAKVFNFTGSTRPGVQTPMRTVSA